MSTIRAAGIEFDAQAYLEDPVVFQPAIIDARAKYGFAQCLCTSPPRQLVIREVKGVAYLAVWPNDGLNHDLACEFHRDWQAAADDRDSQSERSESNGSDARHTTPAAKFLREGFCWDVALDLPRPPSGRRAEVEHESRPFRDGAGTHSNRREQFSMGEFLVWLWENANFNRWGQGWRRDWRRVAATINRDAESIMLEGEPLARSLYVPPPFRKDEEPSIHAEWERFAQPLIDSAERGGSRKRGFVLAEVKAFDRTEYGYRVLSRNMARPLFVDDHLHAMLAKASPLALALLPKTKALGCSVVGLWAVEATGRGNIRAVAGALLLVNVKYVPVNSTAELEIANALCGGDRTFTKGVGRFSGADFVIRDKGQPKALLVYTLNSPDYCAKRDVVAQRCLDAGCAVWKWDLAQQKEMPALPSPA